MLCSECNHRDLCTSLCPEAELEVSKVEVPEREINIGIWPKTAKPIPELKENTHLTPREKEIVTLLGKGLNRADVCQLLGISRATLRKHIERVKKKYLGIVTL